MELTFNAKDQASAVVTSVQKKIESFGKDVGKSIVSVVGPLALVGTAIGAVTNYLSEVKQKAKEAFDWGAGLSDAAAKMGVTVEQFQGITSAADKTSESVDRVGKAFKLASDLIVAARAGNAEAIKSIEALGFKMSEIDKAKPEEVLRALAAALATTEDPAQRAALAVAALGKSAAELQDVLAKGFDIAGALEGTDVISTEEADLLRERARKEKKKDLDERVRAAKEAARVEFLATKEGMEFVRKNTSLSLGGAATYGSVGATTVGPTNEQIDAELARIRKEKKDAEDKAKREKEAATAEGQRAAATAAALAEKSRAETEVEKKKEKQPKEPKEGKEPKGSKIGGQSNADIGSISVKTPPLTVSSLREIGGGIAGERVGQTINFAEIQVNLQERMLKELETLNNKSRDNIDFTKPPAGLRVDRVIA